MLHTSEPFYQISHFNLSATIVATGSSAVPFQLLVKITFKDGHSVIADRTYSRHAFSNRQRGAVIAEIIPDAILWFQAYHGRAADLKPRINVFVMMLQEVIAYYLPRSTQAPDQPTTPDQPTQLSLF